MSSHYCSQNLVLVMEEMGSSGNLPKGIGTGLSAPYESTEARLYVASVLKQPGRARSCEHDCMHTVAVEGHQCVS